MNSSTAGIRNLEIRLPSSAIMYGTAERNLRDCREGAYFLQFAKNVTSQGGEDGILEQLFVMIGTTSTPYCVDIGAWDGQHLSNTYRLAHDKQWGALLVEANTERCNVMRTLYDGRSDVNCVDCLVDISGPNSLSNLLTSHNVPVDLDFLSIDVDGADYHLWQSVGASHHPRVVCIEFNPTIPNHVHYIQECDITIQEGSSLLAITELGRSLGYHIVVTTTFNAIFVRMDLMSLLPAGIIPYQPQLRTSSVAANSSLLTHDTYSLDKVVDLSALHNGSMVTDIFQTYSGELKLCGPKKLLWHRVSMNIQQMQAIKPKRDRVFPFAPPYTKTVSSLEEHMNNVTIVLVGLMACHSAESVNSAQIPHLESGFNGLVRECMDVYGVSDIKTAKKPLQSICQDILINTLAMCMITYQHLTSITIEDSAASADPSTAAQYGHFTVALLHMFISNLALSFEIIGDSAVDHLESGGSATTSVHLTEGKLWLQRAFYLMLYLQDHPCTTSHSLTVTAADGTVSVEVVAAALSRLSRKISTCCLHSASHTLPWKALLAPSQHSANTGQVLGEASCSPAADVDEMLQGLYWKHLAATTSGTSTGSSRASSVSELLSQEATAMSEEELKLKKLGKKWQSKLGWYDPPSIIQQGEHAHTDLLAPVALRGSRGVNHSDGAPPLPLSSIVAMDSLGVLLNSCWSSARFFSRDVNQLSVAQDEALTHTATASLLLRLAEQDKQIAALRCSRDLSGEVPVWKYVGFGFCAGCIAMSLIGFKCVFSKS